MFRIAHAKAGRDGKRRHPGRLAQDRLARQGLVDRHQGGTTGVVSAGQGLDGVRAQQFDQSAGLDLQRVVAGQQHADGRALAFDHGVRSERGRQRHQIHSREHFGWQPVQRAADALRQIERRGQAFGGRNHLAGGVKQHRIGERAAGVDTQEILHLLQFQERASRPPAIRRRPRTTSAPGNRQNCAAP